MDSPTAQNVIHSTDYLAQKYSGFQAPLAPSSNPAVGGAGGQGRKMKNDHGDDLVWTQNEVKLADEDALGGGHGVPLSSEYIWLWSWRGGRGKEEAERGTTPSALGQGSHTATA